MSWFGGYKSKASTSAAADVREEKRKKLEAERAERVDRAKKRAALQKQLQAAQASRLEADKALQELYDIAPDIFDDDFESVEEVSEDILNT